MLDFLQQCASIGLRGCLSYKDVVYQRKTFFQPNCFFQTPPVSRKFFCIRLDGRYRNLCGEPRGAPRGSPASPGRRRLTAPDQNRRGLFRVVCSFAPTVGQQEPGRPPRRGSWSDCQPHAQTPVSVSGITPIRGSWCPSVSVISAEQSELFVRLSPVTSVAVCPHLHGHTRLT